LKKGGGSDFSEGGTRRAKLKRSKNARGGSLEPKERINALCRQAEKRLQKVKFSDGCFRKENRWIEDTPIKGRFKNQAVYGKRKTLPNDNGKKNFSLTTRKRKNQKEEGDQKEQGRLADLRRLNPAQIYSWGSPSCTRIRLDQAN